MLAPKRDENALRALFERDAYGVHLPIGRSEVLAHLGEGSTGKRALTRLLRDRVLRVAANRVYYLSEQRQSPRGAYWVQPNADAVGRVFARERGWALAVGQSVAENAIGLSTQVPARSVIAADGCQRTLSIYGGQTIINPAPAWLFEFGEAAQLLIQGTRCWERDGTFSFPRETDWDEHGMTIDDVAQMIALRSRPTFRESLEQDVPRLPEPYAALAKAILAVEPRRAPGPK